ncbi:hypothetical protein [Phocaeicola sp.]
MKKIVLASLMMVCLPYLAIAQSVDDDLYFIPKKKAEKKEEVKQEVKVVVPQKQNTTTVYAAPGSTVVVKDVKGNTRDVDEYNRRYTSRENNFSMENDTLYIEEKPLNERGEWVNGFEGSQSDYEYAMRIVRFRNPRYAIPVSSPLYWDVVYGLPSWDWNVYDDGLYAYAFPTYTNRLWWDWRWNYSYGGGWGFSWGWSSPWYYNSWYSPGYWGGGYWGGYWGWNHHHHYYPSYGWGGGHWGGGGHGWSRPAYYDTRRGETGINRNSYVGSGRGSRYTSGNSRVDRNAYRTSSRNGSNRVSGRVVNSDRVAGRTNSIRPNRGVGSRGDATNNNVYRGDRPRPTTTYTRPSMSNRSESTYTRPSSTRSSVRNNSSGSTYQRSSATNRTSSYDRSNRNSYNSSRSTYNSSRSSSSSSYSSGSSSRSSNSSGSSTRSSGGGGGARRR